MGTAHPTKDALNRARKRIPRGTAHSVQPMPLRGRPVRSRTLEEDVLDVMLEEPFEPVFVVFGDFDFGAIGAVER